MAVRFYGAVGSRASVDPGPLTRCDTAKQAEVLEFMRQRQSIPAL